MNSALSKLSTDPRLLKQSINSTSSLRFSFSPPPENVFFGNNITDTIFRYRETAKRLSKVLQDQNRTSVEQAADWIEYGLRHNGARFNSMPFFTIPWYIYYGIDVVLVFAAAGAAFLVLGVKFLIKLCSSITRSLREKRIAAMRSQSGDDTSTSQKKDK